MSNTVKVIIAVIVIAVVLWVGYTLTNKGTPTDTTGAPAATEETAPTEAPAAEAPAEAPAAPEAAPAEPAPAAPEAAPAEPTEPAPSGEQQ